MAERLHNASSTPDESDSPAYAHQPDGIGNGVAASAVAGAAADIPPDRAALSPHALQQPPSVHAEITTVAGPDGEALERTQLAAIREVLQWLHDNPDSTG